MALRLQVDRVLAGAGARHASVGCLAPSVSCTSSSGAFPLLQIDPADRADARRRPSLQSLHSPYEGVIDFAGLAEGGFELLQALLGLVERQPLLLGQQLEIVDELLLRP